MRDERPAGGRALAMGIGVRLTVGNLRHLDSDRR